MYNGLFIADVHIGAQKYDQSYREYEYLRDLLKAYRKKDLLDFIIIGGDYFDKQFYASDLYTGLASKLMVQLLASCRVLRIVYGTASHDSSQYSMFDQLLGELGDAIHGVPEFDFKVITTVKEEELLPGMKVLYIPEEYIYDKEAYYKEFLSKEDEYDWIFGHGVILEGFKGRLKDNSGEHKNRMLHVPTFKSGELEHACRGQVIFGHYHVHTELSEKTSYVGSFSRWQQDEEEDKGFYRLFFDEKEKISTKEFVVNEAALKYVTIRFGFEDEVYKSEENWEPTAKLILKKKLSGAIYKLRVMFNIPVGYENGETFMTFFKERFRDDPGISVVFSNGFVENKSKKAKERVDALPQEHRIFIDKNVPLEDKVVAYLRIKKGVERDPKEVKARLDE